MAEIRGWAEVSEVAVATVFVLLLAWLFRTKASHRSQRLPPGPRGWPLLGSIPLLGTEPHRSLYKLSKQYGPLMFMRLGSVKTLVVTSPKFAQEILKTHDRVMSSRPDQIASKILFYNCDIAFQPSGQRWRYLRKVVTTGLLTATRVNQFREIREREVLAALHFILEESQRGNAVNMTDCLSNITMNNITQMMMKKSYCCLQKSDSKSARPGMSMRLVENFREAILLLGAFNIADLVPVLKPFDPQGIAKRMKSVHRELDRFLEEIIEEHRHELWTAKAENYQEDFVDALLRIGYTKDFEERLSNDVIKATLMDTVGAGGDTSTTVAVWALSELMGHPCAMRKVQEELDSVAGPHRLVQEEDFPQLKYLNAVIKETLRLHPAGPLLIPHESFDDCEFEGLHIPAGTRVFVNVWAIQRDPSVWERPLEFDPERFLNSNIDYKGQDFELLPFGSGRRVCPAIHLGIMIVMYSLSMLLHAVDFIHPDGEKLDMSDKFGLALYKRLPLTVFGKARLPDYVIYPTTKVHM